MNTNKKTVLLFQPSKFQAQVWRFILCEQDIFVIWESHYTNKKQIENYFKTPESKPNLLIIDLKIDNVYEICQWLHEHYPSSKLILTSDLQQGYSPVIRRWAVNQGIDELLINFQKKSLLLNVMTNINSVLKVLDCPPVQKESLIRILDSLGTKRVKNLPTSSGVIRLQQSSISSQELNRQTDKNTLPLARYSLGFFIVILLILTVLLDLSMLRLISPVQKLQRRVLFHVREQKKSTNTKVSTLQELDGIPQGIFSYGGSTTWAPIRKIVNPKINQEYPEFNLRYLPAINGTPGSGTGIRMLLEGQLDFSQSSRSIEQKEHILAHQRGFTLREHHVAIDAIAIAVHPSLPVSGLTTEQLKKIYLGEITNWQEVNGPNLEIVPFSRRAKDGGTPEFFQHHVLQNESFGSNVKYVYSTTDGLKQIKDIPGGIYYASAPEVIPQCTVKSLPIADRNREFIPPYLPPAVSPENCPQKRNQLNIAAIKNATYPITRYLSVIVKQDGDRSQKGGEAYTKLLLTKEIQKLIEEAGFVPIN